MFIPACITPDDILMTTLRITRAGEGDLQDLIDLLGKLAEYENLDPPDTAARERIAQDLLGKEPRFFAGIGRAGSRPVGLATWYFTYSTFRARPILFIEDLFVLEEDRGRGYGRQLFEFCRNEASFTGCSCMDWLVLTWNTPSIRFYDARGAKRRDWYPYRLESSLF